MRSSLLAKTAGVLTPLLHSPLSPRGMLQPLALVAATSRLARPGTSLAMKSYDPRDALTSPDTLQVRVIVDGLHIFPIRIQGADIPGLRVANCPITLRQSPADRSDLLLT